MPSCFLRSPDSHGAMQNGDPLKFLRVRRRSACPAVWCASVQADDPISVCMISSLPTTTNSRGNAPKADQRIHGIGQRDFQGKGVFGLSEAVNLPGQSDKAAKFLGVG